MKHTRRKKHVVNFMLMLVLMGFVPIQVSIVNANISVQDLLPYITDYSLSGDQYTYNEYTAFLESIDVDPSDFILGDTPEKVFLANYENGGDSVWVEIIKFYNSQQAEAEYQLQSAVNDYNGPIFQRFNPRERIFVYDQYLFIIFFSPLESNDAYTKMGDLLPTLIAKWLEVLGTSTSAAPTTVVDATWGVMSGDIITWHVTDSTFTGYVGGGTSSSQGEWDGTWEIVDTQNGHILIKESSSIKEVYTEDGNRHVLDVPYHKYTWYSPDDEGITLNDDDGSPAGPALFPLTYNGESLSSMAGNLIDHLPEKDIQEGDEYVNLHGKTHQYSGFTPIETSWMDVTVHRGTGIITHYDFYYNNNEYSITTHVTMSSTYTSFQLNNRKPAIPTLTIDASLSTSSVEHGTQVSVTAQITDQESNPMTDATVTVQVGSQTSNLTPNGGGEYPGTILTESLSVGNNEVSLSTEKTGYKPSNTSITLAISEKSSSQPDGDDANSGGGGIPGFPLESQILGIASACIALILLRRTLR